MIVLHCALDRGIPRLWGEQSGQKAKTSRRRTKSADVTNAHPHDAGLAGLKEAMSAFDSGIRILKSNTIMRHAWLPSRNGLPEPSSALIAENLGNGATPAISPWQVTTRELSVSETMDLLGRCAQSAMLARGVVAGSDLCWLANTLRFAAIIVAKQDVLPGLHQTARGYEAVWTPVMGDADREHMAFLVESMPAACRCMTEVGRQEPPDDPALSVVTEFISDAINHLMRTTLSAAAPTGRASRRKNSRGFDSVHDAWLHALESSDRVVAWEGDSQLSELARRLREWQRPVDLHSRSDYRLCFRLEEPTIANATSPSAKRKAKTKVDHDLWRVRFLLQPKQDRSLLMDLRDVWSNGAGKARLVKKIGADAREYALAALGQAAGLCPPVNETLKAGEPAGYETDTRGAHEFLITHAAALERAGFGVMLPAWWTRKGTKQRISVKASVKSPKMQGSAGLSLMEIADFDYQVALGGQAISMRDLTALAKLKMPLVQFRGEWVELDQAQIKAALDFWKHQPEKMELGQVVRMALGQSPKSAGSLDFEGVEATGWIGSLLKQLEGKKKLEEVGTAEGFLGTLRPYQARGHSWLAFLRQWGLGACLADDMGLGKTIQTLAMVHRERESGENRPVLLICPTSVVNNWRKEAERFTPSLDVMIHHGSDRNKRGAFEKAAAKHALVISSYGLLQRDVDFIREVAWAGVILDEAQNIKNPETKQSRAARSISADYRIALTGTPVENHVGDLWAIMEFLNPGFLGTHSSFKEDFFKPIQILRDPDASEKLKRMTGPFILRRLKTDKAIISDLPDKMEMKTFCTLTREQASLYAAVLEDSAKALEKADGIQRKGVVLALLSKLKQVCNHPAQFLGDNSALEDRSGKLARLTEMIEEVLEAGERSLVFSQFAEMGDILQRHLQDVFGREVLFLHGGVSKVKRDRMVERFQQDGGAPPIFVLSLKAGGTGLNLTQANHVFHYDRWWNPSVENQATDRAFRIGQKRNVQVHKFICAGTFEERIDDMIERKTEIARNVVGTGEGWLTELSNDQLREILTLGKEAVGD